MPALVIVETHFGNTRHIPNIVADVLRCNGIDTEVVSVEDAPTQVDDDIDLLVIGAPTHDIGPVHA
jgi:menaquinone-dependent protoporphyrinogen IX oxidase